MNIIIQKILLKLIQLFKQIILDLKKKITIDEHLFNKFLLFYKHFSKYKYKIKDVYIIETIESLYLLLTCIIQEFKNTNELTSQDIEQLNDIKLEIKILNKKLTI
jgi:hypothetical protein